MHTQRALDAGHPASQPLQRTLYSLTLCCWLATLLLRLGRERWCEEHNDCKLFKKKGAKKFELCGEDTARNADPDLFQVERR